MSKTAERNARPRADRHQAELVNDMSHLLRQAVTQALARLQLQGETDRAALMVERATSPVAPARLASFHPGGPAAQARARELYQRCLRHYREVVRAHEASLGVDDVGAAVALFVAANVGALRDVPATPAMLLQLERQLGGVARHSSAWASASTYERQMYFEQMAILAVLIGESAAQARHQGPAARANVQRAARGYLHRLLGLDPDQLTLDANGLSLRETCAASECSTG
jgi:hypothetical protein